MTVYLEERVKRRVVCVNSHLCSLIGVRQFLLQGFQFVNLLVNLKENIFSNSYDRLI